MRRRVPARKRDLYRNRWLAGVCSGNAGWEWPLSAAPRLREGWPRAPAVTDFERVRLVPDVPTLREAGFPRRRCAPGPEHFVPARTPPAAVARLPAALRETLLDAAVQAFFDGTGVVLWYGMDTKRFSAFLSEELPRIALIARLRAGPR
jgi:tripartite-type tricarboxylate transporter receptor subunit TctC